MIMHDFTLVKNLNDVALCPIGFPEKLIFLRPLSFDLYNHEQQLEIFFQNSETTFLALAMHFFFPNTNTL